MAQLLRGSSKSTVHPEFEPWSRATQPRAIKNAPRPIGQMMCIALMSSPGLPGLLPRACSGPAERTDARSKKHIHEHARHLLAERFDVVHATRPTARGLCAAMQHQQTCNNTCSGYISSLLFHRGEIEIAFHRDTYLSSKNQTPRCMLAHGNQINQTPASPIDRFHICQPRLLSLRAYARKIAMFTAAAPPTMCQRPLQNRSPVPWFSVDALFHSNSPRNMPTTPISTTHTTQTLQASFQ